MIPLKNGLISAGIALSLALAGCSSESSGQMTDGNETHAVQQQAAVVDITISEAKALIDAETAIVILDVRTPEEFAEGHIEGAVNVDFRAENFAAELAKLDRNQRYIIHCRSGRRSSASMEVFEELGFTDILHMFEGFNGWQDAQLPIAR